MITNIILIILCINFVAFSTYIITEILTKYIYSYSKSLKNGQKIFLLFYSGLIFILLPLITSINLALLGETTLAYYNIIYNVLLDTTISSGILILISKKEKRILNKKITFVASLVFTIHLFLIIKRFLDLFDSFIFFILFIVISMILIKGESKNLSTLKVEKKEVKLEILIKIFFILISFSIFIACGQIISYLSIYLKNILNNVALVAYIVNLISNTVPTLFFGYFIYKISRDFGNSHISILGQYIYSFTICTGIICGMVPIYFASKDLLTIISSFLAIYSSLIVFNLYSFGHELPKEVGLFLILLGLIVGLMTTI